MTLIAKAPGKCILFGEHSVVYGYPALVTAINIHSTCTIDSVKQNQLILELVNFGNTYDISNISEVFSVLPEKHDNISLALEYLNKTYDLDFRKIKITLSSDLFPNAGLGSSASTAVALIAAINAHYDLHMNRHEISSLAYEMEKVIHGTPSGIDNAICTNGGLCCYERGELACLEKEVDFPILITNTLIKRNTSVAIQKCKQFKETEPQACQEIFNRIGQIVKRSKALIDDGNIKEALKLATDNQSELEKLGLSNEVIDNIVSVCLEGGAWGSKLTGAGLGGVVISFGTFEVLQNLKETLISKGYPSIITYLQTKGVQIERKE